MDSSKQAVMPSFYKKVNLFGKKIIDQYAYY